MDTNEDAKRALKFLKENRLATLATIAAESKAPHAAFVYYMTDNSHHIYIATEKHSKKIVNIQADPHVALVIGQEVDPKTLQMEGEATIVQDTQKQEELIRQYAEVSNQNLSNSLPPLLHLTLDTGMAFIEVTITHFKFSNFADPKKQIIEGTPADW